MLTKKRYWSGALVIITTLSLWTIFRIACKASDNSTELIFNRIYYYMENLPRGLDPNSPREMIVGGGMAEPVRYSKRLGYLRVDPQNNLIDSRNRVVDLKKSRSDEAVLLVHGATNVPRHLNNIFNHLKNKNRYDIFGSLMPYHGRSLSELSKVNNGEISKQLKDDIEYLLSLGYSKIYCIGHSFGGAHLANLSMNNAFGENASKVKMVLYMPSIAVILDWLGRFTIYPFTNIKKYVSMSCEFDYCRGLEKNGVPDFDLFYICSRSLLCAVDTLGNDILKKARKGFMSNDFSIILSEDDTKVDTKLVREGFVKKHMDNPMQKYVKIFEDMGHQPHAHNDPSVRQTFTVALDEAIAAL